jgi:hypothetical protein
VVQIAGLLRAGSQLCRFKDFTVSVECQLQRARLESARTQLGVAYEEKANELADTVSVLTAISKELTQLLDSASSSCGS